MAMCRTRGCRHRQLLCQCLSTACLWAGRQFPAVPERVPKEVMGDRARGRVGAYLGLPVLGPFSPAASCDIVLTALKHRERSAVECRLGRRYPLSGSCWHGRCQPSSAKEMQTQPSRGSTHAHRLPHRRQIQWTAVGINGQPRKATGSRGNEESPTWGRARHKKASAPRRLSVSSSLLSSPSSRLLIPLPRLHTHCWRLCSHRYSASLTLASTPCTHCPAPSPSRHRLQQPTWFPALPCLSSPRIRSRSCSSHSPVLLPATRRQQARNIPREILCPRRALRIMPEAGASR